MSSSSSIDARTADKATIAWSRGRSLSSHLADLRLAPTPELRLHELAKIDRDGNAANDRGLAERAPCAVVHRDPSGGIRAGHGSNGGTRCTVVQLCGAAFLRSESQQAARLATQAGHGRQRTSGSAAAGSLTARRIPMT